MKKVFLLTILYLAILYLFANSQDVDKIERLYTQGLQQIEQKEWESARKTFKTILSINLNHANSYYQLRKIFVDNYDYFRADLILNEITGIKNPGSFIISYHYPLTKLPEEFEKDEPLLIDLIRIDEGHFAKILEYYQNKVLDDHETWHHIFDWELIRMHVYSALTLHGEPILFAAKWVGDFFDVKKAFAKP